MKERNARKNLYAKSTRHSWRFLSAAYSLVVSSFLKAEHSSDQTARENLYRSVVVTDNVVVVLTGDSNPIFSSGKLVLQSCERIYRFQIRIILKNKQQT